MSAENDLRKNRPTASGDWGLLSMSAILFNGSVRSQMPPL